MRDRSVFVFVSVLQARGVASMYRESLSPGFALHSVEISRAADVAERHSALCDCALFLRLRAACAPLDEPRDLQLRIVPDYLPRSGFEGDLSLGDFLVSLAEGDVVGYDGTVVRLSI